MFDTGPITRALNTISSPSANGETAQNTTEIPKKAAGKMPDIRHPIRCLHFAVRNNGLSTQTDFPFEKIATALSGCDTRSVATCLKSKTTPQKEDFRAKFLQMRNEKFSGEGECEKRCKNCDEVVTRKMEGKFP